MNAVGRACRLAAGALCGLLLAQPFAAGGAATAGFHVAVRLASTTEGTCVSEPLNESADFRVSCTSGQFVSISPSPPRAFVGTPGNAFRYHLMPTTPGAVRSGRLADAREAPASATAMQVSPGRGPSAGPVEILVSF